MKTKTGMKMIDALRYLHSNRSVPNISSLRVAENLNHTARTYRGITADMIELIPNEYDVTESGNTIEHYLCCVGFNEYKRLIKNTDRVNNKGWSPLFMACYHNNETAIISLIEASANIRIIDFFGHSAQFYLNPVNNIRIL